MNCTKTVLRRKFCLKIDLMRYNYRMMVDNFKWNRLLEDMERSTFFICQNINLEWYAIFTTKDLNLYKVLFLKILTRQARIIYVTY
jgi:hypothetical protein